jgi:hypothetical protein
MDLLGAALQATGLPFEHLAEGVVGMGLGGAGDHDASRHLAVV